MKRLLRLFRAEKTRGEVHSELAFHIDQQTEANIRAGMSPDDARHAAEQSFGRVEKYEEECHDARGWTLVESIRDDVRFGLRLLARNRIFGLTVIATLAIAIGACATMFSVVDAVLLRPLAFPQPAGLQSLFETSRTEGYDRGAFSPPNFIDVERESKSFRAVAAYYYSSYNLAGRSTELVPGVLATPRLFDVLGVAPQFGRPFAGEDGIVISHGLATRQYGTAAGAVNQALFLDGKRYTVAGVMPPDFHFPRPTTEVWLPLLWKPEDATQRGAHYLRAIGRLAPNADPVRAARELEVIGVRLAAAYPDTNEGASFTIVRYDELLVQKVRRGLLLLLGAVAVLALIACANIANLLLVRAANRNRETSLRAALGATRTRLMRQLLTESLVLAAVGGIGALGFAYGGIRLLERFAAGTIPRLDQAVIDGRVILFTVLASLAAGLLFGILPAFTAARPRDVANLKTGGTRIHGQRGGHRLRSLVAASQLALAVTLLAGAMLLVRSFVRVNAVDLGFEPENVVTFDISLPATYETTERIGAFHDHLLERLRTLPGVTAAGATSHLPIAGGGFASSFRVNGEERDEWSGSVFVVDDGFFRALGIPLVRGRLFDGRERFGAQKVVLANEAAVRRFWPNRDPLGLQLRFGASAGNERYEGELVGIVRDIRQDGLEQDAPEPTFYVALRQAGILQTTYVLKTSTAMNARALEAEVGAIDRGVAVANVATMASHVAESIAGRRFQMVLLTFFAATALLLASIGIYGVIAYSVAQRTQEIGVRVALGASVEHVFRMVVGEAVRLVIPAVAGGIIAALALNKLIASLLFGVSATDVTTLAGVATIVAVLSIVTACIPARRATRVSPVVALRYE